MMMKKGDREVNIEMESIVDTLVVQGDDLVQVVAKGVPIADDVIFGGEATSRKHNQSSAAKRHANTTRQVGDGLDVKQSDDQKKIENQGAEIVDLLHFSSSEKTKYKVMPVDVPSHAPVPDTDRLDDQSCEEHASEKSPYFDGVLGVSTHTTPVLDLNHSISSKPAKNSKLNPEARLFTPSPHRHVLDVPAVVPSIGYILDPSLMATGDAFLPDYNVTGHARDAIQPITFASPYHFEAAYAYMHQNSQNLMVGQMGQPVYLPPLAHDAVSAAGLPQLPLPPLLAQYQAHLPQHQDHFKETDQT
ncbi:hypothetical protein Leryth_024815 [Lithospermum erythrorhizon]|nr:hypothetical protein Leryth_024815 [Lithospermum erythrorhizon]